MTGESDLKENGDALAFGAFLFFVLGDTLTTLWALGLGLGEINLWAGVVGFSFQSVLLLGLAKLLMLFLLDFWTLAHRTNLGRRIGVLGIIMGIGFFVTYQNFVIIKAMGG